MKSAYQRVRALLLPVVLPVFRLFPVVFTVLLALGLLGGLVAPVALAQANTTSTASLAMPSVSAFRVGNFLTNGWMCYGWPSGRYNCTAHWHWSNGRPVSDNPAWVPTAGGVPSPAPRPSSSPPLRFTGGGSTAGYPFGQCTWGAARLSWDNVTYLGNARDWFANAQRRGLRTGFTPRVGATVVYQAGVQGASALGHVAHVVAVYANGTFKVEEMNYFGYGGGFGIFSYRMSHTGWGVGFIY